MVQIDSCPAIPVFQSNRISDFLTRHTAISSKDLIFQHTLQLAVPCDLVIIRGTKQNWCVWLLRGVFKGWGWAQFSPPQVLPAGEDTKLMTGTTEAVFAYKEKAGSPNEHESPTLAQGYPWFIGEKGNFHLVQAVVLGFCHLLFC